MRFRLRAPTMMCVDIKEKKDCDASPRHLDVRRACAAGHEAIACERTATGRAEPRRATAGRAAAALADPRRRARPPAARGRAAALADGRARPRAAAGTATGALLAGQRPLAGEAGDEAVAPAPDERRQRVLAVVAAVAARRKRGRGISQ